MIYPQLSQADSFTSADVLAWDRSQQDWYFQVSVGMAGIIASQNRGEQAECINDWYFAEDNKVEANTRIREAMARFQTFHPMGVLLAVIEKQCGQMKFTE